MSANVLIVEDDAALREALCDTLEIAGYATFAAADGGAALDMLASADVDVVVSDVQMHPVDGLTLLKEVKSRGRDLPVLLMTAYGTVPQAVDAIRDGAADYLVKPFEAEVLVSKVSDQLRHSDDEGHGMIAVDARSCELLTLARRVAQSEATVMITGESGTGKEVLARYIHRHSPRAEYPFVAINCAAIPENMLEAVLFGYEKGAFTGAYKASSGKFEQAQAGSLLLDEISEMALGLQAKLLRVLQEREVERLGGRHAIALDIRVIATSNRDMLGEVAAGRFREDLYYRLNVFPMNFAPLRDRREDIVPLARYLAGRIAEASGRPPPGLDESAVERLQSYDWPGNVRELDNVMQRALILRCGESVAAADLRFESRSELRREPQVELDCGRARLAMDLKARELDLIVGALRAENGSRKLAAARLGISPRTLRYKIARLREAGVPLPEGLQRRSAMP